MKIAVYTLTRDRLEYTQQCFASLHQFAGCEFFHVLIDNGSTDGTKEWLAYEYAHGPSLLRVMPENIGISRASNLALDLIFEHVPDVDVICKIDNDCLLTQENTLGQMAEIVMASGEFGPAYVLSPQVEGIVHQPHRAGYTQLAGRRVGLTSIVGGLFHCVPASIYKQYRYSLDLPLAWGQDDHFCNWVKSRGGQVGYVEGITVEHYEGTDAQAKRYPAYYSRKWQEEKSYYEEAK